VCYARGAMNPVLVCIPTYNERDNVEAICTAVVSTEPRVDVLVVDDNSPDGTGQLADALAAKEPRIRVLHREKKEGLGRAYLHAFQWALDAGYQYVVEMDADFSHDPRYLPRLLDEAMAGADLVLGSRYVEGGGTVNWGAGRKVISRGGSLYARSILGVEIRDLTGGFKCFNRRVLEGIDLGAVKSTGYAFQIELTYRTLKKGFKVKEIPIVFEDRRVGQSKMSRKIFLEALTMVWKLRLTV
jgi:dolichol-phosphate mannosyltransferase